MCLVVQNYFHLHPGLHFMAGTPDLNYYTSPDIPGWVFLTASIVMGFIGPIGVVSNLYVIVGYFRNKTVSKVVFQNFNWCNILIWKYIDSNWFWDYSKPNGLKFSNLFLPKMSGNDNKENFGQIDWWMPKKIKQFHSIRKPCLKMYCCMIQTQSYASFL